MIKLLTKPIVVVSFTKIFMSDPVYLARIKEGVAKENLSSFIKENKEEFEKITDLILDNIKGCKEVEQVSIKASVKLGDYSFQEAEVDIERPSTFRKTYLALLKALEKVDEIVICKDTTICSLAVIITLKVIIFK